MPKRKRPEDKPEEQFERFIETARDVEADTTGESLERAFNRIATKKPSKKIKRTSD